jgi:H+/gluconate symporter-like permease
MIVEIIEVGCAKLQLTNSCVTFNSTRAIQKILATYSCSISGVCIITLNTGATNVYKFTFSCIGDDGTINTVSEQFPLETKVVKSCIVNYAVELIKSKGE